MLLFKKGTNFKYGLLPLLVIYAYADYQWESNQKELKQLYTIYYVEH
jgi:branched-subunit amino acid transport protein AzlD